MTFLFNPLKAVMQALKLKFLIFTDFHPGPVASPSRDVVSARHPGRILET